MSKGIGIRGILAIGAAKAASRGTRILGRGGTALPGLVAERVSPTILRGLTRQLRHGSVMVTGTNGKTTTSRMLSSVLHAAGWHPIHNRSGSNLVRGLVATVVTASNIRGKLDADSGLFEVDEATVPAAAAQIRPRLLLINNLFRDQLDRYGEVDTVHRRWRESLATLPPQATLALNADDPAVAVLAQSTRANVLYYGVEDTHHALSALPHAADAINCPICNHRLLYSSILLSHLGHYRCPNCGFARPEPQIKASRIDLHGVDSLHLEIDAPGGQFGVDVAVPGFYNAYNALAAVAAALGLGLKPATIQRGLSEFTAAFGRIERVTAGASGKDLLLLLVKNPVGFNEVLRMLFPPGETPASPRHALIIINDLIADGRDVSWLWDVDFELLAAPGCIDQVTCAGIRATDMANRLKYAGVDPARIHVVEDLDNALDQALATTPTGDTLYIMPTYTAMLAFRDLLHGRGWVQQFWET